VLTRRSGDFTAAEDAVQEALVAAHATWPRDGIPDNPRGWLLTTATRRLVDEQRSDAARRRRERAWVSTQPGGAEVVQHDDTLTVLLLCCDPGLSPASAVALTLRAVGGLTTREIAAAYGVPEATMAQRISRAKRALRERGQPFALPVAEALDERVARVLAVLYLLYTEGYAATTGRELTRPDRSAEAIRLARLACRVVPDDPEVRSLLALMLLLEARRPARVTASGDLVPLAEQDRSLWDRRLVVEGTALLDSTLHPVGRPPGAYQVQAAIAAVHDRAPTAGATDWPQVLALYGLLEQVAPGPFVTLARAVATAEALGPDAAEPVLDDAAARLPTSHRVDAVRGHLAALRGDVEGARQHYRQAARRATNLVEQRYLLRLAAGPGHT
jgi:RNA polymerase sigma factor (sigma-70 family)